MGTVGLSLLGRQSHVWVRLSPVHGKGKMFCSSCFNPIDAQTLRMRRGKAAERTDCGDCASAIRIKTKYGVCFSHVGEYDENEIPVGRSGKTILAGGRKCGNSDCINPEHCVTERFLERFDISYRTGKKLSDAELLEALEKEKVR